MGNFNYLYSKTFVSMSWLKTIYESIVNEIGADDAYNRFYSSIPREDYDEILGGNPAPDKFIQFILNCVRDGKSTKEDAVDAVRAYNGADQLVKQNVLNKFRTGEYSDALDIAADIKYMSSGGAILSRNKFAKEGLIKLKENDRWIATCTTNYMASNHYFGDSHWCTASDREGRYDGYLMYKDYTGGDSVLIQFKWKGKVLPKPENDDVPESLDDNDRVQYDDELGYVGDAIAKDDSMYQAQIDRDGYIGQICDWDDNSSSRQTLKKVIGKEMYSVLEDHELIKWLLNKTNESVEKEEKYQAGITELIKKKRERKEAAYRAKKERLEQECEQLNAQKEAFVLEKWKEFVDNKLYKDPNIVSYMYERDVNNVYNDESDSQEEEEKLAKTNYAVIQEVEVSDKFSVLQVSAMLGLSKYVDYDYDMSDCEIKDICMTTPVGGVIALIVHNDGRDIDHVIGPYENASMSIKELRNGAGRWERRFYSVHVETDDEMSEFGLIFDAKLNKAMTYRGVNFYEYSPISSSECVMYRSNIRSHYVIYNTETGEYRKWKSGDPGIYTIAYGGGISLCDYDGDTGQVLYVPERGLYGLRLPDTREVHSLDISSDFPKEGDVIGILFKNHICNAMRVGDNDYLFGIDGLNVTVTNPRRCGMVFTDKSAKRKINSIIIYEDGNFKKTGDDDMSMVPCDRYGQSEEEKIRRKNFKDWMDKGGHSPEVKAQMDKMWADRNKDNNDFSGDAALKAWNDDDRGLDRDASNNVKYSNEYPWNTSLQKFDKDDRWNGHIAAKDPVDFRDQVSKALGDPNYGIDKMAKGDVPDYVRKNPWYRIGRDGKPIDQPWYDEDEIPANLSDRIVREQKIANGLNKMRSLWDRMGLND